MRNLGYAFRPAGLSHDAVDPPVPLLAPLAHQRGVQPLPPAEALLRSRSPGHHPNVDLIKDLPHRLRRP